MMKRYSELIKIPNFIDRVRYLYIGGIVGEDTFGHRRHLNQTFYRSNLWRTVRRQITIRDGGFDLGHKDRPIFGSITVHHINPITPDDILNCSYKLVDPENLISVSDMTHRYITYGGDLSLLMDYSPRVPGDTIPWRK